MAHEIETKVLDIDSEKIQEELLSIGAKKTKDTKLIVNTQQVPLSPDLWSKVSFSLKQRMSDISIACTLA